jgi:hypothetical protein
MSSDVADLRLGSPKIQTRSENVTLSNVSSELDLSGGTLLGFYLPASIASLTNIKILVGDELGK